MNVFQRILTWLGSVTFLAAMLSATAHSQDMPRVLDERMHLELFASEPDIVTPIGATFDQKGRLLVIESHTHQRERDYDGPPSDRIRIIEDTDGDGRADQFRTFYEGTEYTMSVLSGPENWIYVATRMKIFRIRDTDGDDRADDEQTLIHLETRGNYPHNGLSGLALDGKGRLYFGIGENLGADYVMHGADDRTQAGAGEGGVFYCDLDGKNLTRVATGFWNPFGIFIDPVGRIFAVGNDPDGRPPCRMVQVVETGDYGFQFRYGRPGVHPLQAWDGELPGTLPMVAGTGEAPGEIAAYHGRLYVGAWGDFRIERYALTPVGASFHAHREIVVQGGDNFRPVGFAESPDGSLYLTDWVDASYPVHGKGRIWKLSFRDEPPTDQFPPLSEAEQHARRAAAELDWDAFKTDDVFLRQGAVAGLVKSEQLTDTNFAMLADPRQRLGLLQALRWKLGHSLAVAEPPPIDTLRQALADSDPDVRLYAIRWVADAGIADLRAEVEGQLQSGRNTTPELFQATIAAMELLDTGGTTFDARNRARYTVRIVRDVNQPAELRALALRMTPSNLSDFSGPQVAALIESDSEVLRREAVRALAVSSRDDRFARLAVIAKNRAAPDALRADAIAGLAIDAKANEEILRSISGGEGFIAEQRAAALRRLEDDGEAADLAQHPAVENIDAWMNLVGEGGDAEAGWRVFFAANGVRCAQCHRVDGRGANTGPDLTGIVARTSRRDVLQSILQPSRAMAPMFVPTILQTGDGRVLTGLWHGFDAEGKRERFQAADGTTFEIDPANVDVRRQSDVSIMPDGLHQALTLDDIRNLLALLSAE